MLRIAVCDDDADQLKKIGASVKQYFSAHPEQEMQLCLFSGALGFLEHLDQTASCDIALLDICMPGLLGTEVAKEIRRRHDRTEIIFLTSSDEYAVDAFALRAVHYLLKPFNQAQFDEAMNRAMRRFADGAPKRLTVRTDEGILSTVDINDIHYIESLAHKLIFHINDGIFTEPRRSLARVQEELEELAPGQFVSPYKGYVVNFSAVRSMKADQILLCNGETIPLAKRSFRTLRNQYLDFAFREGQT